MASRDQAVPEHDLSSLLECFGYEKRLCTCVLRHHCSGGLEVCKDISTMRKLDEMEGSVQNILRARHVDRGLWAGTRYESMISQLYGRKIRYEQSREFAQCMRLLCVCWFVVVVHHQNVLIAQTLELFFGAAISACHGDCRDLG
jgi:hypothetical protein